MRWGLMIGLIVLGLLSTTSLGVLWWWSATQRELMISRRGEVRDGTSRDLLIDTDGRGVCLYFMNLWHRDQDVTHPAFWNVSASSIVQSLWPKATLPWEHLGIVVWDYHTTSPAVAASGTVILVAWWWLIAAPLLPTVLLALRLRRLSRLARLRRERKCERCGYDLRASKDRCPECGTAVPDRAVGPAARTAL